MTLTAENRARAERYFSGRPEITAVFLFGSVARGEGRPGSDLDLGILLRHEVAQRDVNRSALVADLMEVFQRPDIDVVILNDAPPLLLHRVVRDGHLLYTIDDRAVAEFTIRAVQQYEDTKPLRRLQRARLARQLEGLGVGRDGPASPKGST